MPKFIICSVATCCVGVYVLHCVRLVDADGSARYQMCQCNMPAIDRHGRALSAQQEKIAVKKKKFGSPSNAIAADSHA